MLVSRCHKERVYVEQTEGCSFYVCEKCFQPCDTMMSLEFPPTTECDNANVQPRFFF